MIKIFLVQYLFDTRSFQNHGTLDILFEVSNYLRQMILKPVKNLHVSMNKKIE